MSSGSSKYRKSTWSVTVPRDLGFQQGRPDEELPAVPVRERAAGEDHRRR
jgi:hypothetical protein